MPRPARETEWSGAVRDVAPPRYRASARRDSIPCQEPSSRLLLRQSAPHSSQTCWPSTRSTQLRPGCRPDSENAAQIARWIRGCVEPRQYRRPCRQSCTHCEEDNGNSQIVGVTTCTLWMRRRPTVLKKYSPRHAGETIDDARV